MITSEFDLSEPNEIDGHFGWSIDFRQIESGPMDTRVAVKAGDSVTLLEIKMNRSVHQSGRSPDGVVTFGLPRSNALHTWHGTKPDIAGLLNFGTAQEFDGVSGSDFTGMTISIDRQFISDLADRLGLPVPFEPSVNGLFSVCRDEVKLRGVHATARHLLLDGVRFDELEQEELAAQLISTAAGAEKHQDRSTASKRARAVRASLDFIMQRPGEPVGIGDVCAATGASWRTLDRGYKEQFGIGPKAYINRMRLGHVRSQLLKGRSGFNVVDAANKSGFWHMGQFAKDYRMMFGELPSQTVRKSHRKSGAP